MKVEIVNKPSHLGKSNAYWLEIKARFDILNNGQCLRVSGISKRETGAIRMQAYREVKARSFQRVESGQLALYLYKG